MIIRRKHTANFTTIGNALFNDERLEADELGILAFLRSKPHDWDVRRPALARRFRIGRDSIKRIVHSWLRTGWCVARKTRLANGSFHVIYEIRDEPGPELSEEEIKAALTLVSSGAGHDQSEEQDAIEHPPDPLPPPTENPSWGAAQPSLAQPSPADPPVAYKTLQNTDSQRKESTKRLVEFADVKQKWPSENLLSEVASQQAFLALGDAEKEGCLDGIAAYLADCKTQNRKVCDLTTYIRERRWERFAAKQPKASVVLIKHGTPQWQRWFEHYLTIGDEQKYRTMESRAQRDLPYDAPSEWPPPKGTGQQKTEHAA